MDNLQSLLIEKVKQYDILYNKKVLETAPDLRTKIWVDIGEALNITAEAAEKTWNYLKKCYVSARASEHESTLPRQFEKQMEFLVPHIESGETQSGQEDAYDPVNVDVVSEVEKRSKDYSSEVGSNRRSSTDDMCDITLRIEEDDDDDIFDHDTLKLTPENEVQSSSGLAKQTEKSEEEGVSRIKEWVNQASESTFKSERESISVLQDEDAYSDLDSYIKRKTRDFEAKSRRTEAELREKFQRQSRERSNRSVVSNTMHGWRSRHHEDMFHNLGRKQKVALQKRMVDERVRRLKKQVQLAQRQRRRLERLSMSDCDDRSTTSSVVDRQLYQGDIRPSHRPGPSSVSSYEEDPVEWELASIPESSAADSVSVVGHKVNGGRGDNRRPARTYTRKHMTAHGHFDEDDIFFLSMARMCSKFSAEDQAILKYNLTNYMLDLEQQAKEEDD